MDYRNHFLFSETYLNDVLDKMKKDEIQEHDTIFENIYSWYQEYKDAWTLFEDIVLDTLGFEKVPDGLFRVLKADMGKSPVIAYVLDKECDLNSTVKGKYYAVDAVQYAKKKDINWAIVTNGIQWRLYNTTGVSPYEFYFEADLCEALETGKADTATRAFGRMFSAMAYKQDVNSRVCLMDSFNEASHSAEENIEDVLRSKAESILKGLCYGLKENMCLSVFDEKQRRQIYDDAIVLLYRLLFLGYAEARNLLPVVKDDPDNQDSFRALCRDARDYYVSGNLNAVGEAFDLWTRLDSQLRIYVDKNYNGGLFSNEDKPVLREYRIANKHLAICLMELAYVAGKKKDYLQKIEYKDLSVRNLGAIYEGLLEYQLFIADELMVQRKAKEKVSYIKASETRLTNSDKNNLVQPGEIYLSQDAVERKETGAYYTPEDVVEYIVKNTVGEKLAELKKELDEELAELRDELSYEPIEQSRQMLQREIDEKTVEFINDKILSLSIIDSAMGSGHFLLNAAYQVANFVVDLLETNCWENDEINADVAYWKRRVVENCIYGIDINNLSVLLARLSLWLISASNDKALSFIDHHLKCGNSIVGTTLNRVQYFDKDFPILTVTKEQYMYTVMKKYEEIKSIGSDTKADVEQQHRIYEEILCDLRIIKKKLDYYLASSYAGGISDKMEFHNILLADDIEYFEKSEFLSLFEYAEKQGFFHWELEFPDVYLNGGFDVYIGNPPYVEADASNYIGISITNQCHNLYTYMIEVTMQNCKDSAYFGVILPSACVSTPRMESFQKMIIDKTTEVSFATFDDRPGKLFTRLESMRAAIIYGKIGNRIFPEINTTKYIRFLSENRSKLFSSIDYQKTKYYNLIPGIIPKIGCKVENSIIEKMFSTNKRISDYIDESNEKNAVYYGYGVRYWIKAMDKSAQEIDGLERKSTGEKEMHFMNDFPAALAVLILNSSMFFWYFTLFSDCRNLTRTVISNFPFDLGLLNDAYMDKIKKLAERLMEDYLVNSKLKETVYARTGKMVYREYYVRKSKWIIDEVDDLLAQILGLNVDEVEFLKNYEISFRTGGESDV